MLRRVADVLGATVHVDIQGKKQQTPPVVADGKTIYGVKCKDLRKRSDLLEFELDFLRKEKVDVVRNFRIVQALYKEAVTLRIIPFKNPLDGIEVDIKIAKGVNRV